MTLAEKVNLAICNEGGAAEFSKLLDGCSELNEKDKIYVMEDPDYFKEIDKQNLPLVYGAELHIRFVKKFGCDRKEVVTELKGKRMYYFAYQEEFDAWIEEGMVGLFPSEVDRFLEKFLPVDV